MLMGVEGCGRSPANAEPMDSVCRTLSSNVRSTQCKQLELALLDIIDLQEDSLRFYYLGKDKGPKVTHYGVKESYDLEAAIII